MSAQIVRFSDDLLSQYEDKKQEEIFNFDSLFPPVNFDRMIRSISLDGCSEWFYGHKWSFFPYYNYIGYHIYIPRYRDIYQPVLSVNETYDTIAYDCPPEGVYEVIGMVVTDDECDDIKQLIRNAKVKDPNMLSPQRYLHFLSGIGSIKSINADIHNGVKLSTRDAMLILHGANNYLYYAKLGDFFYGAFLVEQYDYIKEYLLNNEWVLGTPGEELSIYTKDGLKFRFEDTIGVSIKELATKERDLFAIMKVGPDSILYSCSVEWGRGKYYKYESVDNSEEHSSRRLNSDTLDYLYFRCNYDNSALLVRKHDYVQMAEIDKIFFDKVTAYRKKQEKEEKEATARREAIEEKARKEEFARREAIEKARKEEFAQMMKEEEHRRQQQKQSLISKYGDKYGLLIFNHKVTLGMTKEMCLKSWGTPRNKVVRKTPNGTQEVWIYGIDQYLIFVNGILTETMS